MKNQVNTTVVILSFLVLIIVAISTIAILKITNQNAMLRKQVFSLSPGEKIPAIELIDMNEQIQDIYSVQKKKLLFIYIFERPCSPCNRNIIYWKRISEIMEGDAEFVAVLIDDLPKALEFSQKKKTNFPLYVPTNRENFVRAMKIKSNAAQTILVNKSVVERVILGDMDGENYTDILIQAKKLVN